MDQSLIPNNHIAIVGMSGRFPCSRNIDAFWENLYRSRECITFFSDKELIEAGVDAQTLNAANYVKARGVLDDVELFDASFFGIAPTEAALLDPQQRLLLECCWEACEHAGYSTDKTSSLRGAVYVGQRVTSYYRQNLLPAGIRNFTELNKLALRENMHGRLAARVARILGFTGPTVVVQTACSTSLVAVHMAIQSLLNNECDLAIAGGVSISFPQISGYWYHEGGIGSPDGHIRAFDEQAGGTVGGNGCGIVVLRKLSDAVLSGDTIHAVIRGSAMNNDGNRKVGFSAPSIPGQVEVILEAMEFADTIPEQISYIEAHGTGTTLGDPLELRALDEAFRHHSSARQFCGIGSVKTNIGHLDAAAGIASLIKTVLALNHKTIPASLNFLRPTPHFDFANSPFYIVGEKQPWQGNGTTRRAGVSSFGMGGTNVHLILEEAPSNDDEKSISGPFLLPLSARSAEALKRQRKSLSDSLSAGVSLDAVEHTLQVGRKDFPCRSFIVASIENEAAKQLVEGTDHMNTKQSEAIERNLILMFHSQSGLPPSLLFNLFQDSQIFRKELLQCSQIIRQYSDLEMGEAFKQDPASFTTFLETLNNPIHKCLFQVSAEYSLAKVWINIGVRPSAVVGYGMGELTAACIAGLISQDEMLRQTCQWATQFDFREPEIVVAIDSDQPLPEGNLTPDIRFITDHRSDQQIVAACSHKDIEALISFCTSMNKRCHPLDLYLQQPGNTLQKIQLDFHRLLLEASKQNVQNLPLLLCRSKNIFAEEELTYSDNVLELPLSLMSAADFLRKTYGKICLLEIGFSTISHYFTETSDGEERTWFPSFPMQPPLEEKSIVRLYKTLGQLWISGVAIEWSSFNRGRSKMRIPLPTYPFERTRYYAGPNNPITKSWINGLLINDH